MAGNEDELVAYDLRQIYAIEIVGTHLKILMDARLRKDYLAWYNALVDLYTVSEFKFKKEKFREEYKTKMQECEDATKEIYLNKQSFDLAIERNLRAVERLMYSALEDAKLFGSKWDTDGL